MEIADREAQARSFGAALRSQVLALVKADEQIAGEITSAAAGLQALSFDTGVPVASEPTIQAAGFHGMPFPEKPPNPPPIAPPEGWSQDPLMRAAQKIAYGHASDPKTGHMHEFPGMTQAQLAQLVYQKMQRAIINPSGLQIGVSTSDGVPVIYDPKDNVLIVRDTGANAPDGGTVFKPNDPASVADKFGWYESIFTVNQLADGPVAPPSPASPLPEISKGSVGVPGGGTDIATPIPGSATAGGGGGGGSWGDEAPTNGTLPGWGTPITPEEAAKSDGALGILGKIILGHLPPDPNDPDNMA